MQEYPKALYTGDQTHYTMLTANNHEEEQLLRDEGAVDYVDLPEYQVKSEFVGESVSGDSESVIEENKALQEELAEAKTEIERLNAIIEAGIAENEALRQQAGQPSNIETVENLEDLTSEQLRDLITQQGKSYKVRDSKAELIAILQA